MDIAYVKQIIIRMKEKLKRIKNDLLVDVFATTIRYTLNQI